MKKVLKIGGIVVGGGVLLLIVLFVIAVFSDSSSSTQTTASGDPIVVEIVGKDGEPFDDGKSIPIDPLVDTVRLGDVIKFNDNYLYLSGARILDNYYYDYEVFNELEGEHTFLELRLELLNLSNESQSIRDESFLLVNAGEAVSGAYFLPDYNLIDVKPEDAREGRVTFKTPVRADGDYEVLFYFTSDVDGKNTQLKFLIRV